MKVGIVRGPFFNEWEMQTFEKLNEFGVSPVGIGSQDNLYETELRFQVRKLKRFGQVNKIPLISKGFQYFFPYNNYLFGFRGAVRDMDVLHTAETFNTFSLQCVKTRKPTVVTVWENLPFVNGQGGYKRFKKEVISKAQHFIAISQKAKEALETEGVDPKDVSIIPGGIDTETFKPQEKDPLLLEKYGLSKDATVILFAGRLVREKGILDLVYVLKELENVYLLIVGSGPLKEEIIKLAKSLGVAERLIFLNNVEHQKMPEIYNLADVFCLPSIPTPRWEEQFGYVLVEAMACGKPVVSTVSGSIPEIVGEGGVLVPPGDRDKLYEVMQEVTGDISKREKMGAVARKWVLDNYEAKEIARRISKVYKSVGE